MEIEHLRQIIHLSKTLNFSKTAKQLFISQPTFSKHVKSVESYLKTALFIRDGRSVRLTEKGRCFIEDAEKIVQYYDEALAKLRITSTERYTVTIGYSDIILEEWKDQITKDIKQIHPSAEIKLKLCNPSKLLNALKEDRIDLALAPFFPSSLADPTLYMHKFPSSKLALVCPDTHQLAQKSSVRLTDFLSETMLVPEMDIASGQPIYDFFENHSFSINEESRFSSFFEASAMVSMKHGLAVLPEYVSKFSYLNVSFIPIEDIELYVEPVMIWKKFGDNRLIKCLSSYFLAE